jgi:hypothetical protein
MKPMKCPDKIPGNNLVNRARLIFGLFPAIFLAVLFLLPAPAPAAPGKSGIVKGEAGKARIYVNRRFKYSIPIPPGSRISEKGPRLDLSIQSRKGYLISIQAAPAKPLVRLQDMIRKLEASYLGEGKHWTSSLKKEKTVIAGMKALVAVYEGVRLRSKVIIARGGKTDFVFIFSAPINRYPNLVGEFNWMVANFRPPAGEATMVQAPASPSPATGPSAIGRAKHFIDSGAGFSMDYPPDWRVSTPSPFTVVFNGAPGTAAFDATVSIQNVKPPNGNAKLGVVQAVLADLKAKLKANAAELSYFGEKPAAYVKAKRRLNGVEFQATYSIDRVRYRQWTLIVPRPTGGIAHIWSFAAPESRFNSFRPTVEAMLRSWTITGR